MSVSDPLLKKLKGFILNLRLCQQHVTDEDECLYALCETLESIFRKGLKQTSSLFGLTRRDYWHWLEYCCIPDSNAQNNSHPVYAMCVDAVKKSGKTISVQGRGRHLIRYLLVKKLLHIPVTLLSGHGKLQQNCYDPVTSIVGNEVLQEIFVSYLHQLTAVNFNLNLLNCSFLDETWSLPVYKQIELVPCSKIGINVELVDGRPLVVSVEKGSVADEYKKICSGDIIDDILGSSLRNARCSKIRCILTQNQGRPIRVGLVRARQADGTFYRPVHNLIKKANCQVTLAESDVPTTALIDGGNLPQSENKEESSPVHDGLACFSAHYIGSLDIGSDGGVHVVEGAISKLLEERPSDSGQPVEIEIGEKDVIVRHFGSQEILLQNSFTTVSSCGRRLDNIEYFSYIAGDTTCTISKDFVAYVFRAKTAIESKVILSAIAQGFSRTHWLM